MSHAVSGHRRQAGHCGEFWQNVVDWNGKPIQHSYLVCSLKNSKMISVHFQSKPLNITVIQIYAPTKEAEVESSMKTYKNFYN